jgi:hypothetical protein
MDHASMPYSATYFTRKCSYCGNSQHTIRNCNHHSVSTLTEFIINEVVYYEPDDQENYLFSLPLSKLKIMCVILNKPLFSSKYQIIIMLKYVLRALHLTSVRQNNQNTIIINTIPILAENIKVEQECPICMDSFSSDKIFTTNCDHRFCIECLQKHMSSCVNTNKKRSCPLCRTQIDKLTSKQPVNEDTISLFGEKVCAIK